MDGGLVLKDAEVQESLVTAVEARTFRSITGTTCILQKRLNRASPQNMGVMHVWSVLCVLAHVCVCGNKCSGHILDPKHCFLQVSAISTSPAWGFYMVFLESLAMDGRSGGFAKVQMSLLFFLPLLVLWHESVSLWPHNCSLKKPRGTLWAWHCHYWTTHKCSTRLKCG